MRITKLHLKQLYFDNADLIERHPYDYMKYGGYDFSEMLTNYNYIYKNEYSDKTQDKREILHFKF